MPFFGHKRISENEKMIDTFELFRINNQRVSEEKNSAKIQQAYMTLQSKALTFNDVRAAMLSLLRVHS